jgi:hypothetical protein
MENLAKALSAAQGEFSTVPQTGLNPFHKSKYSTIEDYVNSAKPVLAKHGLSISQSPNLVDGQFVLTTILMHESGEHIASNQPIFSAKQDAQSMGSAITYARRYAYGAVLGMASGDYDDDGNAATKPEKGASTETPKTPKSSPPKPSGSPNKTIEERVNATPDLAGLNALYTEVKEELQAMKKGEQDSTVALFAKRKAEIGKETK